MQFNSMALPIKRGWRNRWSNWSIQGAAFPTQSTRKVDRFAAEVNQDEVMALHHLMTYKCAHVRQAGQMLIGSIQKYRLNDWKKLPVAIQQSLSRKFIGPERMVPAPDYGPAKEKWHGYLIPILPDPGGNWCIQDV